MSRLLLLIEDDPFTGEWIEQVIREYFSDVLSVRRIPSEKNFITCLSELRKAAPTVAGAVVDMLVPWEDGTEEYDEGDQPPSDDAEAGIRVLEKLRSISEFSKLPVLIYTVNDRERQPIPQRLAPFTEYMRKDEPDERFRDWIRKHCFRGPS